MANMESSGFIPTTIHRAIESQKRAVKEKHKNEITRAFVDEWLSHSYEGYTLAEEDLKWVCELAQVPTTTIIKTSFSIVSFVFKAEDRILSLLPMFPLQSLLMDALRMEISEQTYKFRLRQFHKRHTWTCEETGRDLRNTADTQVDHHFRIKTFHQLMSEFTGDLEHAEVEWTGTYVRLKDRSLAKEWSDFHQQHAVLRLLHRSANTNPEYYLQKYPEGAPFAPKPKQRKPTPEPNPTMMTFDAFFLAKDVQSKDTP